VLHPVRAPPAIPPAAANGGAQDGNDDALGSVPSLDDSELGDGETMIEVALLQATLQVSATDSWTACTRLDGAAHAVCQSVLIQLICVYVKVIAWSVVLVMKCAYACRKALWQRVRACMLRSVS
jgi:hypothetical protein